MNQQHVSSPQSFVSHVMSLDIGSPCSDLLFLNAPEEAEFGRLESEDSREYILSPTPTDEDEAEDDWEDDEEDDDEDEDDWEDDEDDDDWEDDEDEDDGMMMRMMMTGRTTRMRMMLMKRRTTDTDSLSNE